MEPSKDNTNSEKDPCVDYLVGQFEKFETFHQERFQKAKDIISKWQCDPPTREYSWQNKICVPAMVEAEQTITPRIITALFPNDAPLDIKCEGDTKQDEGVIIRALIQHYFRVNDVRGKSSLTLSQNTLLGTGYAEAGTWLVKRGYTIAEDGSRKYEVTDNRPDFQPVDFFEIFPHPNKLSMDDGLPLFRRRWMDAEYLKSIAENPFYQLKELAEALKSDPTVKREDSKSPEGCRKEYEILEYFGPYDHTYTKKGEDGKEEKMLNKAVPYWTIIINRKIKVRHVPNPWNHQLPPFVKTNLYPEPRPSWFGVGIGQIGLPTQERLNKIVNQRLDNVELVMNKMGFYNGNDPLLNPRQLQVSEPGKWIKCSDPLASARWMDIPDVTASSYKEEEMAKNDFRESVGATSALMPSEDPKDVHRTAMGIQMLQGTAGMRFKPVLTNIETDYIAQIASFFLMNCKQFMAIPEWVEIMGEGAKTMMKVTPSQIRRKVKFIATGISETMNREVQIGQLLRFKEITVNDPTINRSVINKRIAELFGFKDPEEFIVKQQAPQQGAPQPGGLSPEQQNLIKQRQAEGASPEQIKMEMLGAPPADQPQEAA